MGRINLVIPNELENKLRVEITKQYGLKKGNIQRSMEEAIRMWIEANQKKRSDAAKKAWDTRREKE